MNKIIKISLSIIMTILTFVVSLIIVDPFFKVVFHHGFYEKFWVNPWASSALLLMMFLMTIRGFYNVIDFLVDCIIREFDKC
jgi:drug/metabolite transporter (DMT)-like permease